MNINVTFFPNSFSSLLENGRKATTKNPITGIPNKGNNVFHNEFEGNRTPIYRFEGDGIAIMLQIQPCTHHHPSG